MGGPGGPIRFRLRPTLTAGQVSTTASSALGGQVVDSATMMPIANGSAFVALEQADSSGVDRIVMEAATDSNGNFSFCPVPMGMFDVVAVATDGTAAYGPTVVTGVSPGNTLGMIPVVVESGMTPAGPATIQGTVTASSGMAPTTTGVDADIALSALHTITVPGGMSTLDVTIPLLGMSTATVATAAGMTCPMGTNCADYMLMVPPSNASVGAFSSSGTMFSMPAAGDVLYKVEAQASMPMSGGTAFCSPSTVVQDLDDMDMPLKVTAGMTTMAKQIDFTGCM